MARANAALQGAALIGALAALAREIVAVRGIGGYHLLCDAGSETRWHELRRASAGRQNLGSDGDLVR